MRECTQWGGHRWALPRSRKVPSLVVEVGLLVGERFALSDVQTATVKHGNLVVAAHQPATFGTAPDRSLGV